MDLDDEDLALLGFARDEEFDFAWMAERAVEHVKSQAVERARRSYDKRRKPRKKLGGTWAERNPEAYAKAHRAAGLAYYYRNREAVKQYQAQYRARKKAEREQDRKAAHRSDP